MSTKICIAGKNSIAVKAAGFVKEQFSSYELVILPCRTDLGVDTWQPSLKKWAQGQQLRILSEVEALYGDANLVLVSLEYDRLLQPSRFTSGALFNIHFSLLPAFRGSFTSVWPILENRGTTGVTLHLIDSGIDTGAVIDQSSFTIKSTDTSRDVYLNYLEAGFKVFEKWFDRLVVGDFTAAPQPVENASFYSRKSLDFSRPDLDLKQTAWSIHNQVRAFTFREYQLPTANGIPIDQCEITSNRSLSKPGTFLEETAEQISVATIDYDVRLRKDTFSQLIQACKSGDVDKSGSLLQSHLLGERTPEGWTPLIVAAFHGRYEVAQLLIQSGADINKPNYKGTTPLMYAMTPAGERGDFACMRLLLDAGADTTLRDISGRDAHEWAMANGWNHVAQELR